MNFGQGKRVAIKGVDGSTYAFRNVAQRHQKRVGERMRTASSLGLKGLLSVLSLWMN